MTIDTYIVAAAGSGKTLYNGESPAENIDDAPLFNIQAVGYFKPNVNGPGFD
ncbi:hypothetical protein ES703_111223 [subsurface metagenome]